MPAPHTMTFRRERFTDNTVRFRENVSEEDPRGVPFLYVTKWLYEKLERPDALVMTLQPGDQQ